MQTCIHRYMHVYIYIYIFMCIPEKDVRKPVRIWELQPALWGSSGIHRIRIVCAHVCTAPGICIGIYIYRFIQVPTIVMYDLAKVSVSNMVTVFFGSVQHLWISGSVVFFASQGLTRFASA